MIMKPNTPDLMKFKRLQRRLSVSVAQLVGHLELLWIATAKNAPEGDIGRFQNEDIAIACHWDGDPDLFISALVECKWLDESDEWRLVVHDWDQHAPSWVVGNLARHGRKTVTNKNSPVKELTKQPAMEATKELTKQPAMEATTSPVLTSPNQSYPSPTTTKPVLAQHRQSGPSVVDWGGRWEVVGDEFLERVRETANKFKSVRGLTRELVWQACWVAVDMDRDSIDDCAEAFRRNDVQKPKPYLNKIMRNVCERNGCVWDQIKTLVPPPPPIRKTMTL